MSFDGFLVVDKPGGMTSRDVVNRALSWFPRKARLGHAGTLDPLATGVLVIGVGQATRLIDFVQRMPKVYTTTIVFGATSDTDDADGTLTPSDSQPAFDEARLSDALATFVGDITQTPPAYSAAKIDGHRAHALARQGKPVDLSQRTVTVSKIDLNRFELPEVDLEIACGKGTYIRSMARDLGQLLGCGGYVKTLRRTRIGPYTAESGLPFGSDKHTARNALRPMHEAVAGMPLFHFDEPAADRVRHGSTVKIDGLAEDPVGEVVVLTEDGRMLAIGAVRASIFYPDKVMQELEPKKAL
jgi:tRNA pseudouridine55 synthase